MKRALIYYSLSGNTEEMAKIVAEKSGADLYRIDTAKPMPEKFSAQVMYGGMQATFGLKPDITGAPDVSEYDAIIIGTPIWAGKHAPAVNTLIADKSVRDKVVAVFTLDGGGNNSKCIPNMKKLLPNMTYTCTLKDKKLAEAVENMRLIDELVGKIG